ncbi:MAG: hypothetical protein ACR2HX_08595 [Pyrinomonadaceae bacterium]
MRETFNQPAKLAERVLAPGDGAAPSLGSMPQKLTEPAKLATYVSPLNILSALVNLPVHLPPTFVGSDAFVSFPRLGCLAWG